MVVAFETDVLEVIQRTRNVKSFRFRIKGAPDFKPGQFFFVTIKIEGVERTKHFSFSNSPTEKGYVEFTKRITESPFSKALDRLKTGDWARLKMPYGAFTFEGEYKKAAFLSGGIGITPIRSIIKFVVDKKVPAALILLYGNNTESDIIFKDDFDNIQGTNDNFRVRYTLTGLDADNGKWSGRRGYIDAGMVKEEIPDYKERIFYICGPPVMVTTLVDMVKNGLGVPKDNIKTENFTGY